MQPRPLLICFAIAAFGASSAACPDDGGSGSVEDTLQAADTGVGDTAANDTLLADSGVVDTTAATDTIGDTASTADSRASDTARTDTITSADTAQSTDTTPSGEPLGMACSADTDCGDAQYVCFLGFCTTFCRDQGTGAPFAEGCPTAGEDALYPGTWGCPSDFIICTPGDVSDKGIACLGSGDCAENIARGFTCAFAGLADANSRRLLGVCLPDGGGDATGDACTTFDTCAGRVCSNLSGCSELCFQPEDCPEGFSCLGEVFQGSDGGALGAGFCQSLTTCEGHADCNGTETCGVGSRGDFTDTFHFCHDRPGATEVGESCAAAAQCTGAICRQQDADGAVNYCTQTCQGDFDCPEDMHCLDASTSDGATYKTCIFGDDGHTCPLDVSGYCEAGLTCVPGAGTNLGTCTCECMGSSACELGRCDAELGCILDDPCRDSDDNRTQCVLDDNASTGFACGCDDNLSDINGTCVP